MANKVLGDEVVVVPCLLDDSVVVHFRLQDPIPRGNVRDVDPLAVQEVGIVITPSFLEALAIVHVFAVLVCGVARPKRVDDCRATLRRPDDFACVFVHQTKLLPREKVRMVVASVPSERGNQQFQRGEEKNEYL